MSQAVRVRGLRELQRDFKKMSGGLSGEVDDTLKEAAEIVAQEARSRFSHISSRSAQGYKPRLKGFGRAYVQQSRRKTTGKRGDYGALQMRKALLPALGAKEKEVVDALDKMLGRFGGEYGF